MLRAWKGSPTFLLLRAVRNQPQRVARAAAIPGVRCERPQLDAIGNRTAVLILPPLRGAVENQRHLAARPADATHPQHDVRDLTAALALDEKQIACLERAHEIGVCCGLLNALH